MGAAPKSTVRSILREPLVHFLALGGLLFLFFAWKGGGSGPGSTRITITPGVVEHLASGFARTWQRPPTQVELKGLVDDYVKEEIATREAIAMGLDRDDTIIRRRLRQKLEFLIEDAAEQAVPTDIELQAWLDKNPQAVRLESHIALRQVYFSAERHGENKVDREAMKALEHLRAAGVDAKTDDLGDASMLPRELPLGPMSDVSRVFGGEFATEVETVAPGQWSGPIASPYGLHLVLVVERTAAVQPSLSDVRPIVEREFLLERRRNQLDALYERLLQRYTVDIDMPKASEPGATANAGSAPETARP